VSAPFTREDMVDAIATAISDSLDADWNSRDGAEAVVRNCGVFELYEALDRLLAEVNSETVITEEAQERAAAALARARGEAGAVS
jgi:hypothetical protein